jgi:hypothetical protein
MATEGPQSTGATETYPRTNNTGFGFRYLEKLVFSCSFTHGLSQQNPLPYSTRGASLPPRSSADFSYGSLLRF